LGEWLKKVFCPEIRRNYGERNQSLRFEIRSSTLDGSEEKYGERILSSPNENPFSSLEFLN
jgi:hypothetical protein